MAVAGGEMPQNIEEVFTANGLSLFPFTLADIRSKCPAPDKANPRAYRCNYYQLATISVKTRYYFNHGVH